MPETFDITTQKADRKPISMALLLNHQLVEDGFYTFYIRPEDLTRQEPTRTNVQQTIGGAWLDNFGVGLSTISIQGHTGWRGTQFVDGGELFRNLREKIFLRWHDLRESQQNAGQDPDASVEMLFLDDLNDIHVVVAPSAPFTLRRSRARPLLYQYGMQFTVLRDIKDPLPIAAWEGTLLGQQGLPVSFVPQVALDALTNTITKRQAMAIKMQELFAPVNHPLADLAVASAGILEAVKSLTSQGIDIFDAVSAPVVAAAAMVDYASKNITQAMIIPLALTEEIKNVMRDTYQTYQDSVCNLRANFVAPGQYLDFSGLFGASNCSSTTGGRPPSPYALMDTNPFLDIYTGTTPPLVISADGQAAINEANQDVLILSNQNPSYTVDLASRIAKGIKIGP